MSSLQTLTQTSIKDGFQYKNLDKMAGKINYGSITHMQEQLMLNAASVQSSLGGFNHGLAGLVENPVSYFLETNHHFNQPPNPGQRPDYPEGAIDNERE